MWSLAELQSPDERTLRFTPLGLATGHKLTPGSAADYQQKLLSIPLVDAVPQSVRDSFDRIRGLHTYGVLYYDLFTAAHDLAQLILEQALRTRFMEHCAGTVPLVARDGTRAPLAATNFGQVHDALSKRGGTHRKAQRISVRGGADLIDFRGTLTDLLSWAREERLLHGQRNRWLENVFVDLRNEVAHPSDDHLVSPVESARAIRDLAEIINRLWGGLTPGGRLYPSAARREVMAVGWAADARSSILCRADQLGEPLDREIAYYLVVRAVAHDPNLWDFDARREMTQLPSEYLWGPGGRDDAIAWVQSAVPQPDEVEYLDRPFLIHDDSGTIGMPHRPEAAATLEPDERVGTWHLVLADYPSDAVLHVRNLAEGGGCAADGACPMCSAESRLAGAWDDVIAGYEKLAGAIDSEPPSDARAPARWSG